jgi:hypothetical protein
LVSSEISFNVVFLTNLFGDINVVRIFYKSSQTCDTKIQNDVYFGTERVHGDNSDLSRDNSDVINWRSLEAPGATQSFDCQMELGAHMY